MTHAFGTPGTVGKTTGSYYSVWCVSCTETDMKFCPTQQYFVELIKGNGWKQISGQWTCPGCVFELEKVK